MADMSDESPRHVLVETVYGPVLFTNLTRWVVPRNEDVTNLSFDMHFLSGECDGTVVALDGTADGSTHVTASATVFNNSAHFGRLHFVTTRPDEHVCQLTVTVFSKTANYCLAWPGGVRVSKQLDQPVFQPQELVPPSTYKEKEQANTIATLPAQDSAPLTRPDSNRERELENYCDKQPVHGTEEKAAGEHVNQSTSVIKNHDGQPEKLHSLPSWLFDDEDLGSSQSPEPKGWQGDADERSEKRKRTGEDGLDYGEGTSQRHCDEQIKKTMLAAVNPPAARPSAGPNVEPARNVIPQTPEQIVRQQSCLEPKSNADQPVASSPLGSAGGVQDARAGEHALRAPSKPLAERPSGSHVGQYAVSGVMQAVNSSVIRVPARMAVPQYDRPPLIVPTLAPNALPVGMQVGQSQIWKQVGKSQAFNAGTVPAMLPPAVPNLEQGVGRLTAPQIWNALGLPDLQQVVATSQRPTTDQLSGPAVSQPVSWYAAVVADPPQDVTGLSPSGDLAIRQSAGVIELWQKVGHLAAGPQIGQLALFPNVNHLIVLPRDQQSSTQRPPAAAADGRPQSFNEATNTQTAASTVGGEKAGKASVETSRGDSFALCDAIPRSVRAAGARKNGQSSLPSRKRAAADARVVKKGGEQHTPTVVDYSANIEMQGLLASAGQVTCCSASVDREARQCTCISAADVAFALRALSPASSQQVGSGADNHAARMSGEAPERRNNVGAGTNGRTESVVEGETSATSGTELSPAPQATAPKASNTKKAE